MGIEYVVINDGVTREDGISQLITCLKIRKYSKSTVLNERDFDQGWISDSNSDDLSFNGG